MAHVFIPPAMRPLTGGQERVLVEGHTVRAVIDNLDARFPGIKERLLYDDALKPGLAVAVGESVSTLGVWQRVPENAEIHFLPAIGGG